MPYKIELSVDDVDIILNGLTHEMGKYTEAKKKAKTSAKKKIVDNNWASTKKLYKFFQGLV